MGIPNFEALFQSPTRERRGKDIVHLSGLSEPICQKRTGFTTEVHSGCRED
jgi:hypothetical protein